MPFSIVHETEAVISAKIAKRMIWTDELLEPVIDQMLKIALDESEELWEGVAIKLGQYQ